jgi:photosystem II protein
MNVQIQFLENIKELTIPIIKLTKSKNGKTGTATFIFVNPNIFNYLKKRLDMTLGKGFKYLKF